MTIIEEMRKSLTLLHGVPSDYWDLIYLDIRTRMPSHEYWMLRTYEKVGQEGLAHTWCRDSTPVRRILGEYQKQYMMQ